MEGLAKGIEGSRDLIQKAVEGVSADLVITPKAGDLQPALAGADVGNSVVQHTGTIRVEGVDSKEMLTGVVDIVIDQLRQEVRL